MIQAFKLPLLLSTRLAVGLATSEPFDQCGKFSLQNAIFIANSLDFQGESVFGQRMFLLSLKLFSSGSSNASLEPNRFSN